MTDPRPARAMYLVLFLHQSHYLKEAEESASPGPEFFNKARWMRGVATLSLLTSMANTPQERWGRPARGDPQHGPNVCAGRIPDMCTRVFVFLFLADHKLKVAKGL